LAEAGAPLSLKPKQHPQGLTLNPLYENLSQKAIEKWAAFLQEHSNPANLELSRH
jgi:hypothetical protein